MLVFGHSDLRGCIATGHIVYIYIYIYLCIYRARASHNTHKFVLGFSELRGFMPSAARLPARPPRPLSLYSEPNTYPSSHGLARVMSRFPHRLVKGEWVHAGWRISHNPADRELVLGDWVPGGWQISADHGSAICIHIHHALCLWCSSWRICSLSGRPADIHRRQCVWWNQFRSTGTPLC